MRVVVNIIVKEARELLTPQMLAPFVAIMVVFVFIGRAIRGERAKSSRPQSVIVADNDRTALSRTITLVENRSDGYAEILDKLFTKTGKA